MKLVVIFTIPRKKAITLDDRMWAKLQAAAIRMGATGIHAVNSTPRVEAKKKRVRR